MTNIFGKDINHPPERHVQDVGLGTFWKQESAKHGSLVNVLFCTVPFEEVQTDDVPMELS